MTDRTDVVDLTGLLRPQYLLYPSTIFLVAADLFPLAGIAFWHWDAFLLLMLYWMDTAVIAFWAMARIAVTPREGLNGLRISSGGKSTNSPAAVVGFFAVHCGIFMAVHFLFLWVMFSARGRAEFTARRNGAVRDPDPAQDRGRYGVAPGGRFARAIGTRRRGGRGGSDALINDSRDDLTK
jgi:hypothetical protein